jgi:hypothetical protein
MVNLGIMLGLVISKNMGMLHKLMLKPFMAMIPEINILKGLGGRWIGFKATSPVFYNKTLFKTYTILNEKKKEDHVWWFILF